MQIKNYYLFQKNKSPFYHVRFTYEDGTSSSKSTKHKAEYKAREFAVNEMTILNNDDKQRMDSAQFEKNNIKLQDYAADFFSLSGRHTEKKKAFNSSINDRWILEKQAMVRNHILPSPLAQKYLREITEEDIEIFVVKLKALNPENELTANTKNKILMLLKIIFKEAFKEKMLDRLPIIDFRIHGEKKGKDILKVEEIKKLFPEDWKTIYPDRRAYVGCLIAFTTGMRLSEIVGLQIKHIDFTNRSIRVRQSWDKKLQIINATTKNKQSRELVICDKVLNEIKILIDDNPDNKNKDSFLFYGEVHGKPYDHKYLPRHFFNALRKVNINITDKAISFHSIRHSVNTHLLLAGINYLKVKRFLGHSDKSNDMTALYSHFNIEDMEDIRNYFTNLLRADPTTVTKIKAVRSA